MSKRQEIREQRRREQLRNRIIGIALVVVVALVVTFVLILPPAPHRLLRTPHPCL